MPNTILQHTNTWQMQFKTHKIYVKKKKKNEVILTGLLLVSSAFSGHSYKNVKKKN